MDIILANDEPIAVEFAVVNSGEFRRHKGGAERRQAVATICQDNNERNLCILNCQCNQFYLA